MVLIMSLRHTGGGHPHPNRADDSRRVLCPGDPASPKAIPTGISALEGLPCTVSETRSYEVGSLQKSELTFCALRSSIATSAGANVLALYGWSGLGEISSLVLEWLNRSALRGRCASFTGNPTVFMPHYSKSRQPSVPLAGSRARLWLTQQRHRS